MKLAAIVLLLVISLSLFGQKSDQPNVFLITLDGFRWQELFGGAKDSMIANRKLSPDSAKVADLFLATNDKDARKKLMPFMWDVIAKEGQIWGNRTLGSEVTSTNRFWFSYPGYNEILTGLSDPLINSNDKVYNQNITVLETLSKMPQYRNKVAAFASWDVFPFIINDKRSGIPVNAGFEIAKSKKLSSKEIFLNELQPKIPSPWSSVRLDAFTHGYMMEYIKKSHPKIVYVSYGETDDFAHDGRYDHYLMSANRTDAFIQDLWTNIQKDPFYKINTNLIITTDHGRGHSPMQEWKSHGTIYKGSNEIWLAVLGPKFKSLGEVKNSKPIFQSQIAATLAKLMGLDLQKSDPDVGDVLKEVFK